MPAYFSMTLSFKNKRIKPNFVNDVYSQIINFGFNFKSGYWFHQDVNLNEIIEWNQQLLEKGFKLGYTQHVKHDYMQILFETVFYSELRGFWMYSDKEVIFNLLVPEADILNCEGGRYFTDIKIIPLKKLATKLWESNIVDAIQTSVELDLGYHSLSDILIGKNISINPFAILSENSFSCFSNNYFNGKHLLKINNGGLIVESDGTILHHF